ncbi:MAG: hypothetical protein ACXABG_09095, partial [Promethearchaeota archaeon]
MKKSDIFKGFIVTALAIMFTFSLFYLTLELHNFLLAILIPVFPGVEFPVGDSTLFRFLGLICLFCIIIVISLGFITKRLVISKLGTFILFLPTFGHFLVGMFLLIGLQAFQIIL